jgi:hypothetical protein
MDMESHFTMRNWRTGGRGIRERGKGGRQGKEELKSLLIEFTRNE